MAPTWWALASSASTAPSTSMPLHPRAAESLTRSSAITGMNAMPRKVIQPHTSMLANMVVSRYPTAPVTAHAFAPGPAPTSRLMR